MRGRQPVMAVALGLAAASGCVVEPPPPSPPTVDPIPTRLSPFAPCSDAALIGFDCALLTVQLDPDDPLVGPATLPVARATAPDPAARRGVLVFHPGGPGITLLDSLPLLTERLFQTVPQVLVDYDVVVMETPGIGSSTPLIACDPTTHDALPAQATTPAEIEAATALLTTMVEGCVAESGEALLHQSGAFGAARVIDELRQAMGEDDVAFLGVSYGSLVGAAYASAHGATLSALVVDSVLAPGPDPVARLELEAAAQSRTLETFFTWCAATTACAFFQPGGPDAVAAAFDGLVAGADLSPLGGSLDGTGVTLLVVAFIDHVGFRAAGDVLAQMDAGLFDPGLIDLTPEPQARHANTAIIGVDFHPAPGATVADFYAALRDAQAAHPRARPLGTPWSLVWPLPRHAPPGDVPAGPPVVVVGGALDANTPIEDLPAMAAAFSGGVSTLRSAGTGHGQLFHSQCVAHAVGAFLVDGTAPPAACEDERHVIDTAPAGTISGLFVVNEATTRQGESGPGDFIADAMRAATGTTIAMVNAGAMQRGSGLPSRVQHDDRGEGRLQLIVADYYDLLPFGGAAVTRSVTPATLCATLEHGVASLPLATNALVLPSGFSYAVDLARPAGARLTSLTLEDDTTLSCDDHDTAITATLDSFMAGGNGGFTMLGGEPTTFVAPLPALVAAHAADIGAVPTTPAGRIVVAPAAGAEAP